MRTVAFIHRDIPVQQVAKVHELFEKECIFTSVRNRSQKNRSEDRGHRTRLWYILQGAYHDIWEVQQNDTIVAFSDGVLDNVGQMSLENLVSDVYRTWHTERKTPEDLAEEIVAMSLTGAGMPGGKPDDITCVVGFVCDADPGW